MDKLNLKQNKIKIKTRYYMEAVSEKSVNTALIFTILCFHLMVYFLHSQKSLEFLSHQSQISSYRLKALGMNVPANWIERALQWFEGSQVSLNLQHSLDHSLSRQSAM